MPGSPFSSTLKTRLPLAGRLLAIALLSTILVLSEDQRGALAQALSDPLSVFGDRSPGARATAQLRPTKASPRAALPRGEHLLSDSHVVAPEELAHAAGPFEETAAPLADDVLPSSSAIAPAAPALALAHGSGGGFFGGSGGGAGGGTPGGGGGGGGAGCILDDHCTAISTPAGDPEPPAIPIPEPTTWLMALAGFFLIGGLMRSARPALRARRAARPRME